MLTVDGAFDRIGTALRQRGYTFAREETNPDPAGDRVVEYKSRDMAVRVLWTEKARLLQVQIEQNGDWVDFARHGFGPRGLEDSAVDALVRKIGNEVGETSTDSD